MTDREELLNDLDEMLILQSPSLELMSKASEMIEELSAKLDKAKEALEWIDKVNAMDYEYVRVARQALEGLSK